MSGVPSGAYEQRLLPAALEDRLVGWFGRTSGIAILAVSGALWAALITWSFTDPSLTHATGGSAKNALGVPGAIVSDLMLQTLGLGAVLAILAPMLWALELITSERVRDFKPKATFYPLSVLIFAGALSALPVAASWPLNHGYGGILGDMIYRLGSGLFGVVNADRGGLAAGVVLFASGFAALFNSIGVELKDLADAVTRMRRPKSDAAVADSGSSRFEPTLEPLGTSSDPIDSAAAAPRSWFAAVFKRRDKPSASPHAGDGFAVSGAVSGYLPGGNGPLASAYADPRLGGGYPSNGSHEWQALSPHPAYQYQLARQSLVHGGYPQSGYTESGYTESGYSGSGYSESGYSGSGYSEAGYSESGYTEAGYPNAGFGQLGHGGPGHVDSGAAHPHFPSALYAPHSNRSQHGFPSSGTESRHLPEGPQPPAATSAVGRKPSPHHQAAPSNSASATNSPGRHEPSFDARTDAASRAIAERFAPGASAAHASPSAHAPDSGKQGSRKFGPGLLGGISFRRTDPVYKRPSLNLLKRPAPQRPGADFTPAMQRGTARLLEDVLGDFGVKGEIKDIKPGPVVTLFEFEPARGTKSSRVIGLADDIARSMSATAVRAAVVPGRNAIGIELPNARRETVLLREILETEAFRGSDGILPITLGKSIGGEPVVADLARMPHLLVAGTTGSGKSVGVNTMILSLLFRHTPEDCRFLMIDPKMLELSVYNGIPHLLTPVVTDPLKAIAALNWAVREMEERYKRMSQLSVRNIDVFNNRVRNAKKRGELMSRSVQTGFDKKTGQAIYESETLALEPLPYIVIVVDEFADLMVAAGKDLEIAVQRLAQMARAAGIHLIMATQRPSVDIITGTIKANFPTRLSFRVASRIDSRTILNEQGAEQLLGQGDMLLSGGAGQLTRIHGPFVSDDEVEAIVASLRAVGEPRYVDILGQHAPRAAVPAGRTDGDDDLYEKAVAIVLRDRKASTSYLQRRLAIGYNRAADLIERMERQGIITPAAGSARRDVLVPGDPGRATDAA